MSENRLNVIAIGRDILSVDRDIGKLGVVNRETSSCSN